MIATDYQLPWPDFRLVRRIGSGGYGDVYEAVRKVTDTTEEHSAIKVIEIPQNQAQLDQIRYQLGKSFETTEAYIEDVVAECTREIEAMVSLKNSPNICNLEDFKIIKSFSEEMDTFLYRIFIREELLQPVHEYSDTGRLTEDEVLKLGLDICTALKTLEARQFVHRDVSPSNILISKQGDLVIYKLCDFGVARKLESLNEFLSKKGKSFCMPPELVASKGKAATADIYGLGMTMYWYLNGNRYPFVPERQFTLPSDYERAEEIRVNNTKDIPAPAYASEELAAAVLKAIAFRPADRYQSAAELEAALLKCLQSSGKNDHAETLQQAEKKKVSFITADTEDQTVEDQVYIENWNSTDESKIDAGIIRHIEEQIADIDSFDEHIIEEDKRSFGETVLQKIRQFFVLSEKRNNWLSFLTVAGIIILLIAHKLNTMPDTDLTVYLVLKYALFALFSFFVMNYLTERFGFHQLNKRLIYFLAGLLVLLFLFSADSTEIYRRYPMVYIPLPFVDDAIRITPSAYTPVMSLILIGLGYSSGNSGFNTDNLAVSAIFILLFFALNIIGKFYGFTFMIAAVVFVSIAVMSDKIYDFIKPMFFVPVVVIALLTFAVPQDSPRLIEFAEYPDFIAYAAVNGFFVAYTVFKASRTNLSVSQRFHIFGSLSLVTCQMVQGMFLRILSFDRNSFIPAALCLAISSGLIQSVLAAAQEDHQELL